MNLKGMSTKLEILSDNKNQINICKFKLKRFKFLNIVFEKKALASQIRSLVFDVGVI